VNTIILPLCIKAAGLRAVLLKLVAGEGSRFQQQCSISDVAVLLEPDLAALKRQLVRPLLIIAAQLLLLQHP
jgi:hypothetical protein